MLKFILAAAFVGGLLTASPTRAAGPPPVEDYGRLPGIEQVDLSPSGQRYAFIATIGDKRRLVVATLSGQVLEAIEVGAGKVVGLAWAGEDHLLVHTLVTTELGMDFTVSKTELGSCIVIDLKRHTSFIVFGNPHQERVAHTVAGNYGAAQIDGRWYGFFGGYSYAQGKDGGVLKDNGAGRLYADLYKVDLDTGDFEMAAKGQPNLIDWLVSPAGDVAARLYYTEATGAWRVMSSGWAGTELASGRAPTGEVSLRGFGRTMETVLIHVGDDEKPLIREVSLKGGAVVATYDEDAVGSLLIDPATHLWIGVRNRDAEGVTTFFNSRHNARLAGAVKAFPGYVAHLASYSDDFGALVMFTAGGDDSGTYWTVDIAKGSADPLGAQYPTVKSAHVGPVRWVDYKAADGLAMRGVLTLPPGPIGKGLPLVVMPHGGPEDHDQLGFSYWAQAFAARGYAVFQPNFRGSDGSGVAFRDAGFGQLGRKMQTDITDGVAELARQGVVDPKRACIVGWSYGGYAALAGVTVQNGFYRCAVSYGGVADLGGMLDYQRDRAGGASATVRAWKRFMGATSTWGTEVNDISPARLAARADAPILLIHGKDDTVVPFDQSVRMERALRGAGKPVELAPLPGADHWLLQEESRVAMLKASVAFVLKHNPPDAAPTAAADNR